MTTYRVTLCKPGQRRYYLGVQASTILRAECAVIDAGLCVDRWHVWDVTPEPERPVDLVAQ